MELINHIPETGNTMKTYFIYTLTNPENNEIFYVGCTDNPKGRAASHKSEMNCGVKSSYVFAMSEEPFLTVVDQINVTPEAKKITPKIARELEASWIERLTIEGHPLTNRNKKVGTGSKADIEAKRASARARFYRDI